jgi:acyl-CoA thioester hydrolase
MGVVYHANYLVWMEIGRTGYARAVGLPYVELEGAGYLMTVAEASVRYADAARYDDEVIVRTRLLSANPRMIHFAYELLTGERRLATGETKHVFCVKTPAGLRPAKLPERFHAYFGITARG